VSFDASLLVMMGIFWVVYWILRVFFFTPVLDILEQRKSTVGAAQAIHDEVTAETERKLEAERARLTSARAEAMATREKERRAAQARRAETLNEVKNQVQATLSSAAEDLDRQVERERAGLESRAEELAGAIAERLVGRHA